jgi:phosphomannomutase/phosphoglucomutase
VNNSIFREYDIRGVIGRDLHIDETYELGMAIITYLRNKHPNETTLVIGHDARSHSIPIQENVIQAAIDLGINVINIGMCPSPVAYYARHQLKTPLALVITASHNPKEYNGIKTWGVWGSQIQEIKNIYYSKKFYHNSSEKGLLKTLDIIPEYITYLEQHFVHLKNLPIDAVIDCGNGAAGSVMPQLVAKMNWSNVKLLYAEPDGNFPHHEADPTVPENMQDVKKILALDSTIKVGLGLDGDADRMNPMTKGGELVAGDKMLALYAQKTLKDFPGASIVFDIKSSGSLIELLTQWGARPCISPSGHSLIKKTMLECDAKLAGELSCHFFFNDRYFGYDDGIYATLRLFEILAETQQSLEELLAIIPHKESSPEIRIECSSDAEKASIVDTVKELFAARKDADLLTIDGIRASMSYGWGLLRASNTQPVICLRFESQTKEGFAKVKEDFYNALLPHFDAQTLKDRIEY